MDQKGVQGVQEHLNKKQEPAQPEAINATA